MVGVDKPHRGHFPNFRTSEKWLNFTRSSINFIYHSRLILSVQNLSIVSDEVRAFGEKDIIAPLYLRILKFRVSILISTTIQPAITNFFREQLEILIHLNSVHSLISQFSRNGSSEIWLRSHSSLMEANCTYFELLRFLPGATLITHGPTSPRWLRTLNFLSLQHLTSLEI